MNILLLLMRLFGVAIVLFALAKLIGIGFNPEAYGISSLLKRSVNKRRWLHVPTLIVGIAMTVIAASGVSVEPTHIGVVENTFRGTFTTIGPGTHFWPFSSNLMPLVTKVTKYNLRRQPIEIGGDPVRERGVEGDSNSPGRPIVYLWARGWAYPNATKIIDLHRQHGPDYVNNWVERNWQTSLKTVSGQHPYDYVGNERGKMTTEVEENLQEQLKDPTDDQALVFVSQLAIVDFGYEQSIEDQLKGVAQKEFERQQAEQQVLISTQQQRSRLINVTTTYSETVKTAESESEKLRIEAEGQANAIRSIQEALASSPAYIEYQRVNRWNGAYPQYYMAGGGGSVGTLLNLPPLAAVPPTTSSSPAVTP